MVEQIAANPQWFWITLGGLLLAAEMLGASGYLLWSGVSAVVIGIMAWLLPTLSWEWQGALFALMTMLIAYLWWYWLQQQPVRPSLDLNQRNRQLLGTRTTLTEPIQHGLGRVNIGDSSWRAQANEDLPAGTEVEVVAVEGVTLVIRAISR